MLGLNTDWLPVGDTIAFGVGGLGYSFFEGGLLLVEIILLKSRKNFLNTMQKLRLKIPNRYRICIVFKNLLYSYNGTTAIGESIQLAQRHVLPMCLVILFI